MDRRARLVIALVALGSLAVPLVGCAHGKGKGDNQ